MRSLRGSAFLSFLGKQGRGGVLLLLLAVAVLVAVLARGGGEKTADLSEEERLEEFCSSLEGVGRCRVMISYITESSAFGSSSKSRVDGVTLLCDGGDSVAVRSRLTAMLCSLFDIGANRVSVGKLEDG